MSASSPEHPVDTVQGCLEACRRCDAVVTAVVEQDPAAFPAVGPHLRHCVDHFRLLLQSWATGFVEYDARPRERRLERDPLAVRDALRSIASALRAIVGTDLRRELSVSQSVAPGRPPRVSQSSLDRELAFLSGHTIHHIAMMILAGREAGLEIPAWLAVAYSTEAHRDALTVQR
jgi:hypothetical protein